MKFLFVFITINFLVNTALANSEAVDFETHSGNVNKISIENLRSRLEVQGNIYVLNSSGDNLLFEGNQTRSWRFARTGELTSNWSYSSDQIKKIAFRHTWSINSKGQINVHIQQYDKMTEGNKKGGTPAFGKLLKEKKFVLTNFEPITWEIRTTPQQRVVIRLTPNLLRDDNPEQLGRLPISGKDMIMSDNKGNVWTPSATFSGEYIAIKTIKGTLYMSYQPFKGSSEIGFAKDSKIEIKGNKNKQRLTLLSTAAFLPNGIRAKIHGLIKPNIKTEHVGSTHIQSTDKEKEFLRAIE